MASGCVYEYNDAVLVERVEFNTMYTYADIVTTVYTRAVAIIL